MGIVRNVKILVAPGIEHHLDLWVVPLGYDLVLGAPWLCRVSPAIDWGCHWVLWVENGSLITVYGRGGFPPPPARPSVAIVGAHRFFRDLSKDCSEGFVTLFTS